jgi:hypothetical protein
VAITRSPGRKLDEPEAKGVDHFPFHNKQLRLRRPLDGSAAAIMGQLLR